MKGFLLTWCLLALVLVLVVAQDEDKPDFAPPQIEDLPTEDHAYQAEINKLMKIIIDSLYSSREIFMRELISNAADALDKIRYNSLSDPAALGEITEFEVRVEIDKENKLIHIRDTGIGMTRDELVANLGSVAKSGTSEFLQKVSSGETQLIGQFGVGFYSAFLVADRVTVTTKNNDDDQYIWTSTYDDSASYAIAKDPRGNTLGRGTVITLHIKEDAAEFLESNRLKNLINKYNEFIQFPVYIWDSYEKEVPVEPEETEDAAADEDGDLAVDEEDEAEEKEPQFTTVTVWDWAGEHCCSHLAQKQV
jgi:heat shock protein beta